LQWPQTLSAAAHFRPVILKWYYTLYGSCYAIVKRSILQFIFPQHCPTADLNSGQPVEGLDNPGVVGFQSSLSPFCHPMSMSEQEHVPGFTGHMRNIAMAAALFKPAQQTALQAAARSGGGVLLALTCIGKSTIRLFSDFG
jgi:hypothetical protein